ncbi:hypothetical protein FGADI_11075 [Fusarium gaditjirri]|uniref:Uncharacterized protein n=1 Tax=Fusarium gaditjirri TaxID=282569 RepID=A0A8H4WQP9_9HYPO|nr:hypothetical protein FGADI_11075 [Fusarium gaditjirri]
MGPIKQTQSPNTIHPFVILPEYQLLVCELCGFATLPDEVNTHLRTKHKDIALECRHGLVKQFKAIPNLLQDQSKLRLPRIPIKPISCLAAPRLDGLKCRKSGRMFRQSQKMGLHCMEEHLWKNPRGRGRPISGLEASAELPWIQGVACQRFFPSREGSRWFEVPRETGKSKKGARLAKSSRPDLSQDIRNLKCEARAHISDVLEREENYFDLMNQPHMSAKDLGSDALASTGLWPKRTQWRVIFKNARHDILRAMTRLPDRYSLMSDYVMAHKISCTMKALDLVIDRCENTVRYTSRTLLCWLSSPKLHIYCESPFCLMAEKSSETRYRVLQKRVFAFVIRLHRMSNGLQREAGNFWLNTVLPARLERLRSHNVSDMFDVSRGLWPDLGNYLCIEETTMALNESRSSSAENEDEEKTDNSDEDDLDPEGKNDDDDDDGDWDSEDDELNHDDSAYGSDQADFSGDTYPELRIEADGELDIAAFDNFLELLYEICLTLFLETLVAP